MEQQAFSQIKCRWLWRYGYFREGTTQGFWPMTSSDRIHLESNLEKLEWRSPKISLIEANQTDGKFVASSEKSVLGEGPHGPS